MTQKIPALLLIGFAICIARFAQGASVMPRSDPNPSDAVRYGDYLTYGNLETTPIKTPTAKKNPDGIPISVRKINVIYNSGFEQTEGVDSRSGWRALPTAAIISTKLNTTFSTTRFGVASGRKLTTEAAPSQLIRKYIGGQSFKFSAWLRLGSVRKGTSKARLSYFITGGSGDKWGTVLGPITINTSNWTLLEGPVRMSYLPTETLYFSFQGPDPAFDLWVDNVVLMPVITTRRWDLGLDLGASKK